MRPAPNRTGRREVGDPRRTGLPARIRPFGAGLRAPEGSPPAARPKVSIRRARPNPTGYWTPAASPAAHSSPSNKSLISASLNRCR